jgi:pimeloyl-ACP methyl ester carboxylesterase
MVVALVGASLSMLLLSACASWEVRRAQHARASLGDRLYVERTGEGDETVVFIPGVLGSTRYWRAAEFEPEGRRLLYVDLLGFGRSPWPDHGYSLDDHVNALRRTLLDEGATRRITLVAHSFGTLVASEYASRYPDDVERLFLFGAPVYTTTGEARKDVGRISWLAGLTVRAPLLARFVCIVHNALGYRAATMAAAMRRDLPVEVARDGALHFWPSLNGTIHEALLRHPFGESVRGIGPKIVFIHGKQDDVAPLMRVKALAQANGSALIVTDDTHRSYWRGARAIVHFPRAPSD